MEAGHVGWCRCVDGALGSGRGTVEAAVGLTELPVHMLHTKAQNLEAQALPSCSAGKECAASPWLWDKVEWRVCSNPVSLSPRGAGPASQRMRCLRLS